jgi:hypothetical protein
VDHGVVLRAPGAVALEEIVVDEPEPGEAAIISHRRTSRGWPSGRWTASSTSPEW